MLGGVEAAEVGLARHRRAEDGAEHAGGFVVKLLGAHASVCYALQVWVCEVIVAVSVRCCTGEAVGPGAEFHVEAVEDGLVVVPAAAPVAHHHAVKAPFSLEDVKQKAFVVAVELAVVEVVRAHYRPCVALAHGGLEGGEVDFVQGAVVQIAAGGGTAHLLVVDGKVLDAGRHAVLLHALYVRHHHLACEVRVFSHVLEVTAVERGAADVDAGAEEYVFLPVPGFFSYAAAEQEAHFFVPGGGKAAECGECGAGVVGPACLVPFVPEDLGADSVGAVCAPYLGDAEPGDTAGAEFGLCVREGHLFFRGQAGKGVCHTLLYGAGQVEVHGNVLPGGICCAGGYCKNCRQEGFELHILFRISDFL